MNLIIKCIAISTVAHFSKNRESLEAVLAMAARNVVTAYDRKESGLAPGYM